MKKTIAAVLVSLVLLSGLLVGCQLQAGVVKGSGNLKTESFDFSDFDRAEVGSAFEVEVDQSGSYSVSITADDNLFEHIDVSKKGKTLKIGLKPALSYSSTTLEAKITMPDLYGLKLSGASRGKVIGFSSASSLDLELSGASSLDIDNLEAGDTELDMSGASKVSGSINVANAKFNVSGASNVELIGSATDMSINASGASKLRLDDFAVRNADINFSGASTGTVNLSGKLDANLSGASKLSYIGEPTMGSIKTSDGSIISKK